MAGMSTRRTHAFIDLGAWGADQASLDFVRMQSFQDKLRENKLEFILFFDSGKLHALSLKDGKITFLGQTDKEYIQKKLKVTPDKWFTYYDTPHTVGIDIAQAEEARGILSIDKQSTLRDLLQAVMRMRKLPEEQQMDYLVPASVRKFYPNIKDKDWNLEAILKVVVQNQVQRLSEDILISAFQKMDNKLREMVIEKLLSTKTKAERQTILIKFETAVYQIEDKSCYQQYHSIDRERPVEEVLQEKKAKVEKIIAGLFEDQKGSKEALEQVQRDLEKIIKDTLPFVAPSILGAEKLAEQQATSEMQREAQKEVQKDVKKESEREQEMIKLTSEGELESSLHNNWRDYKHDLLGVLRRLNKEDLDNMDRYRVKIYSLKPYLSSKQPSFDFDENIYVSENFALSHEEQEPFFDSYVKNIHFTLNIYDPEARTVKMIILSIKDASELEWLLFNRNPKPENIWIESPVGDVYCGEKPEDLPPSYHDQIQQINYLAGNLGHIYTHLDKATWLKRDSAQKMVFYKEHLARVRDARPQIIEMLTRKLSEAPVDALAERKVALDVPESELEPKPKPLTAQYDAGHVGGRGGSEPARPHKEKPSAPGP